MPGSLFVSCACNKDQAAFIFDILALWASQVVELNQRSNVSHYYKTITLEEPRGVKFKSIGSNANAALGGSYAGIIVDEVAFHRSPKLTLALRSGLASAPADRRLFLQASTVPMEKEHWWYDELEHFADKKSTKSHYAFVKMADARRDDPSKEETWKKSNPSYGTLVQKDSFVSEWETCKISETKRFGFMGYRLQHGHWCGC